jgi:hypothetical protein
MYEYGQGVQQSFAEALKWYSLAAKSDSPNALNMLGLKHLYGKGGVNKNYEEAFKYFLRAAKLGHAESQNSVGVMYSKGEGVEQNLPEAVKWFITAAENNFAIAQFNLGVNYKIGEGVTQNDTEAFNWFKKAAEQGCGLAKEELAYAYKTGKGVAKDLQLATYWSLLFGLSTEDTITVSWKFRDLIKLIPNVLKEFSEFSKVKSLNFQDEKLQENEFAEIAYFIKTNTSIKTINLSNSYIQDSDALLLAQSLHFNITLTQLIFKEEGINKTIVDQIKVSLAQNKDIAELQEYVKNHPLTQPTVIPLELVLSIVEKTIVPSIRNGRSIDEIKKSIEVILVIARTDEIKTTEKQ